MDLQKDMECVWQTSCVFMFSVPKSEHFHSIWLPYFPTTGSKIIQPLLICIQQCLQDYNLVHCVNNDTCSLFSVVSNRWQPDFVHSYSTS